MIDINVFCGNWPFRPLHVRTPEELNSFLIKYGINCALVSPIESMFYDEPHLSNETLFSGLSDFPSLFPVAVIHPGLTNWRQNLELYIDVYDSRAIRLFPNYHCYQLDDNECKQLYKVAGKMDIPVIIQLRIQDMRTQNPIAPVADVDIDSAISIARCYPDTCFVLGCMRWYEAIEKANVIKDLSNLWIDISNIEYLDCLRILIDYYGIYKLLFGTNTPFFIIESSILKLKEAVLSSEEVNQITAKNAESLFHICQS